jgi:molybdenum cofactor cytidylyltransferase
MEMVGNISSDDAPSLSRPAGISSPRSIHAILLAAGQSRRMGAFKPLLPFGASTVIEACVENMRAGGVDKVVVVVGHRGEELRATLARFEFARFAINEESGSEMAVSIARGVEAVPDDVGAVIIGLADYPAVPSGEIKRLIESYRNNAARIVQPEWEGRGGHPILIDLDYREELLNLDPIRGLRSFFEAHRADVLRVPATSQYVTRDIDTWDDYSKLHVEIFGFEPPRVAR